jgi:hypothetical protein
MSAVVVALSFAGWNTIQKQIDESIPNARAYVASDVACLGAAGRAPGKEPCTPELPAEPIPNPIGASKDTPVLFGGICEGTSKTDAVPKPCRYGDSQSTTKVALIGDSHASQYAAAFKEIADEHGWQLHIYSKGRCPFSTVRRDGDAVITEACGAWIDRAKQQLVEGEYDVVFTSQVSGAQWPAPEGLEDREYAEEGLASMWEWLNSRGLPVVAIADVPRPVAGALECLSVPHENFAAACTNPRTNAFLYDPQPGAVVRVDSSMTRLLDLSDIYCDDEKCFSVIGGVTVYRDGNHLTNTFASTLAPFILDAWTTPTDHAAEGARPE